MPLVRKDFIHLPSSYLFSKIRERTKKANRPLLDLGIGEISKPLIPSAATALVQASKEFADQETFRGYPPSFGYLFLREKIAEFSYDHLFSPEEIFIGPGAKNMVADLLDLFAKDSLVAVPDPAYPVYLSASLFAGMKIEKMPCKEETSFLPDFPEKSPDIIYLCSPHNPTGKAFSKKELEKWVAYAKKEQAVILYDGAYEGFITSAAPRSIYEIPGAKEVAIETRSFSKKGGFTNLRCSSTVIPKECSANGASLLTLWKKRTDIKFGGVPYPVQKAASAFFSPEGRKELLLHMQEYHAQARYLRKGLRELGFTIFGGIDAPYIWCKTPNNLSSWEFFEQLLEKASVITIPGEGFGSFGEGFVRFSTFPTIEKLEKALRNIEGCVLCAT